MLKTPLPTIQDVEVTAIVSHNRMPAILDFIEDAIRRFPSGLSRSHPLFGKTREQFEEVFWDAVEEELVEHFAVANPQDWPQVFAFTPVKLRLRGILFVVHPVYVQDQFTHRRTFRAAHLPKGIPGLMVDAFSVIKRPESYGEDIPDVEAGTELLPAND